MGTRSLEYRTKDLPFIKKDLIYRLFFSVLFLVVFIWQLAEFALDSIDDNLSTIKILVTICVLLSSMMFTILCIVYAHKDLSIINEIKKHGSAVRNVRTFTNKKKDSFLKLYSTVASVIAVVMLALLCFVVTYSVLEIIYYSTISYYMPLLFLISFCGFNSVFHINYELKSMKQIGEYNKVF